MAPRNYFSQSQNNPYFQSQAYHESKGGMFEDKVNKKIDKFFSLPRRFWAGIKRTLWSL